MIKSKLKLYERVTLIEERGSVKAGTYGVVVNLRFHTAGTDDGWWMYMVQFSGQEEMKLCHDRELCSGFSEPVAEHSVQCAREFKNGDLLTGIDRSFPRSIYKVLDENSQRILAEWISLDGWVAGVRYDENDKPLENKFELPLGEYRLATEQEVFMSSFERPKLIENNCLKCECGNPKNPIGQGHSDWCKLFRQEF